MSKSLHFPLIPLISLHPPWIVIDFHLESSNFVEFGPKDVLTGLLRRIDRNATGYSIDTPDAITKLISK